MPLISRDLRHRRVVWLFFAFALIWAATCFLPATWVENGVWLVPLQDSLGTPLRTFFTPQVWISLQAFLFYGTLLVWAFCLTGQHWNAAERSFALKFFAGAITAIAGAFLFLKLSATPWPWAEHAEQFGPFSNRNQTAALFCTAASVSAGLVLQKIQQQRREAIVWIVCLCVLTAATTQAGSRAGVVVMAAGVLGLSGWCSFRSRQLTPFAVGVSVLLLAAAYLMLQENKLTQRLAESISSGGTPEGRIVIWKDTMNLVSESPLLGTGIGNFAEGFAQTRDASASIYHVRHPESDWLWLASENGIPGALAVAGLVGLLLVQIPWKRKPKERSSHHLLQIAAAVGVLQFVIFSCIDVPGHRAGTLLTAVFLLGIATEPPKRTTNRRPAFLGSFVQPLVATAIPLVAVIAWITLPTSFRHEELLSRAQQPEFRANADCRVMLDQAVEIRPLDWRGYFLRAAHSLTTGPYARQAQRDFQRARSLAPHSPELPRQEADIWLSHDLSKFAIPAWSALMKRDPSRAVETFGKVLNAAKNDDTLMRQAMLLVGNHPDLQLLALKQAPKGHRFDSLLAEALAVNPQLHGWKSDQLRHLFDTWFERGDHDKLTAMLATVPAWSLTGWPTLVDLHHASRRFKESTAIASRHLQPQLDELRAHLNSNETLPTLRKAFVRHKGDLAVGLQLAQWEALKGDPEAALSVLHEIENLNGERTIPRVTLLRAWSHQRLKQSEEASSAYRAYLAQNALPQQFHSSWTANRITAPK